MPEWLFVVLVILFLITVVVGIIVKSFDDAKRGIVTPEDRSGTPPFARFDDD